MVDINGGKGPNRFGRDVFYLTRSRDEGKGIQPLYQERVNSVVNEHCSTGSDGFSCAEKIRRAGWKIEKDYPW